MRDHSTSGSDVAADALHIVESHEKCDFIAAMGNKSQNATWPYGQCFKTFQVKFHELFIWHLCIHVSITRTMELSMEWYGSFQISSVESTKHKSR